MKHEWTQSPGDAPCIGFMPSCTRCGIDADHPDADKDCDVAQKARIKKMRDEFRGWISKKKKRPASESKSCNCLAIARKAFKTIEGNEVKAHGAQAIIDALEKAFYKQA